MQSVKEKGTETNTYPITNGPEDFVDDAAVVRYFGDSSTNN